MAVEPEGFAHKAFVAVAVNGQMVDFLWCHKPNLMAVGVGRLRGKNELDAARPQHAVLHKNSLNSLAQLKVLGALVSVLVFALLHSAAIKEQI